MVWSFIYHSLFNIRLYPSIFFAKISTFLNKIKSRFIVQKRHILHTLREICCCSTLGQSYTNCIQLAQKFLCTEMFFSCVLHIMYEIMHNVFLDNLCIQRQFSYLEFLWWDKMNGIFGEKSTYLQSYIIPSTLNRTNY